MLGFIQSNIEGRAEGYTVFSPCYQVNSKKLPGEFHLTLCALEIIYIMYSRCAYVFGYDCTVWAYPFVCVCVCDTYSLSTVETEALTKETYGEF